ncbi:MAG: nuclear transport factor 2 family protein [Simkania sp.]|nr:nuclear transport factor 2 family protein [Simkania sp.]
MNKQSIVKAYSHGLENGNYHDVIQLFSPSAIVHSPLYGNIEASSFYKELFSDTKSSKIVLKNIFISSDNPNTAAAHFVYSWMMKDGSQVQFECIDVFDFIPQSDKIQSLTIIYDTYHTRAGFAKIRGS